METFCKLRFPFRHQNTKLPYFQAGCLTLQKLLTLPKLYQSKHKVLTCNVPMLLAPDLVKIVCFSACFSLSGWRDIFRDHLGGIVYANKMTAPSRNRSDRSQTHFWNDSWQKDSLACGRMNKKRRQSFKVLFGNCTENQEWRYSPTENIDTKSALVTWLICKHLLLLNFDTSTNILNAHFCNLGFH